MLQMVTWVLTIPDQQVHLLILPQISAERRIAFWYACSLSFFSSFGQVSVCVSVKGWMSSSQKQIYSLNSDNAYVWEQGQDMTSLYQFTSL